VACDGQGRSLWARTVLPAHMHDQTAAKTEGIADLLTQDPGVNRAMAAVYHLNPNPEALRAIPDRWRPCRTWIALRLRAWLEDVTHEIAQGKRVDLLPRSDQPESGHDPT
jgi:hypothetical protein